MTKPGLPPTSGRGQTITHIVSALLHPELPLSAPNRERSQLRDRGRVAGYGARVESDGMRLAPMTGVTSIPTHDGKSCPSQAL